MTIFLLNAFTLIFCSETLSVREATLATHASDNGALVPVEPVDKGAPRIRQGLLSFVPRDGLERGDE